LTLQEYLVDYATPETRAAGQKLIDEELAGLEESEQKQKLTERLTKIRETDDRDMFF
jgi:2-iminoacetate synthase